MGAEERSKEGLKPKKLKPFSFALKVIFSELLSIVSLFPITLSGNSKILSLYIQPSLQILVFQ